MKRRSLIVSALGGLGVVPFLEHVRFFQHAPFFEQRAHAQADSIGPLLSGLRSIQGLHCSFREEKTIALLSRPVISEGTIDYARPGRFIRRTTRPGAQAVLIQGNTLEMSQGEGARELIDLRAQPVVRSFVDSFVSLLSGDRAALEASYTLALTGTLETAWTLRLVPRGAPLNALVREVRFDGHGPSVERMTMEEVSGDSSVTTFTNVDRNRRYTAAELAQVFRLP